MNDSSPRDMLRQLKGARLLKGFRGSNPVDMDSLADIIVRLSELAADQSTRINEFDLNPLICNGSNLIAVDGLIVKQ